MKFTNYHSFFYNDLVVFLHSFVFKHNDMLFKVCLNQIMPQITTYSLGDLLFELFTYILDR